MSPFHLLVACFTLALERESGRDALQSSWILLRSRHADPDPDPDPELHLKPDLTLTI